MLISLSQVEQSFYITYSRSVLVMFWQAIIHCFI